MPIGSPDVDLAGGDAGVSTVATSPDTSTASASPITFSDDSMFTPPGGTEPVSWKNFMGGHVSRADHDKLNAELGRRSSAEDLIRKAEDIERRRANQQQQQPQQPQPTVDPFASVRGRNVVGGDQVAQIAEQFQKAISGDRNSLTQYATAVNKILSDNANLTKKLDERLGSFESTRNNEQQNSKINTLTGSALNKAGVDLSAEQFGPVREAMQKHAQNHYYSYEPGEGQTRDAYNQDYPARYAADFEADRAAFRQLERIMADQARAARFPGRGGSASPMGATKSRYMSPQERAANFHFGRETANT